MHEGTSFNSNRFPDQSLNFVENIFSLSPNCHRKIHLARSRERLEMVPKLFQMRREVFDKRLNLAEILLESSYEEV